MACQFIFLLLGVAILSCAAVVCAAVSWSRISELSLPLPTFLPALNVLIPILAALILPLSRRFVHQVKERTIHLVLPYLAYGSTFLPFILFILSLVYATPGDIQSCSLERHWLRMFEAKNDRAIRSIQTDLQCCGLNSIHDRAWPFPSRDNDARACERTQGYVVPCGGLWRHQEAVAATLTAIASFLNWLSLVLVVMNFPEEQGRIRLPDWSTSTRLIEENPNGSETQTDRTNDRQRSEQERIWEESRDV